MCRRLIIKLLMLLPLLLGAQIEEDVFGASNSEAKISQTQQDYIFEHFQGFPNLTEIAVALINNERVVFAGFRKINDSLRAIENHESAFEIGALTKVFTTTLLAGFVETEDVSLENCLTDYLNIKSNVGDSISLLQLANHSSGMPKLPSNFDLSKVDFNNPYHAYSHEDLTHYLQNDLELSRIPGKQYEYSHLGPAALGFALEKLANEPYHCLLQDYILNKYEMLNTATKKSAIDGRVVYGLNAYGEVTSHWHFDALLGASGLLSTAEDLSKFAIAQFDGRNTELWLTQQPTFSVDHHMNVALGWHLICKNDETELLWHNGNTGGFTSSMALDLKKRFGVVVLSNVSGFHPEMEKVDELCFALIQSFEMD